ncbi:MAG: NAD(+) kinase [Alphaproteobacteria bacterium CG_4_10_14_0_2_um_filter_63_37]|nr:MAG: hypothetical protein AUJ55_07340 [Proteobacteria bacterium CG1_02_64_396]PJA25225.1 MAG: NAD(+) kinase [Alphaproteobacteria bacterium CG_4_10_14_0_2_um_filter_63_37]
MPFQRIGIMAKDEPEQTRPVLNNLVRWLRSEANRTVLLEDRHVDLLDDPGQVEAMSPGEIARQADLLIVLGGDGTLIAASRVIGETREVPVIGVNLGRLGFLTEVTIAEMIPTLEQVVLGAYAMERRMMMSVEVIREGHLVAKFLVLNDVVVHKGELARMIELEVAVEGHFAYRLRADGLIVASPTGSTAYALSTGGPILHPTVEAMVLAPVCPHTLTNRPIVVPAGLVTMTVNPSRESVLITVDGQRGMALKTGDQIQVRPSPHRFLLLHDPSRNYFDILRQKLRWGEKVEID